MKNIIILSLCLLISTNMAFATRYVTHTYTTPKRYNYGYNYNPSVYNHRINRNFNPSRLADVERSLYGRTYDKQSSKARLNRLEKSIFHRTYSGMPLNQRMDNLIMNYNNSYPDSFTRNTTRTGKLTNMINGLNNMFYGTPTGLTPQVQPYFGFGTTSPNSSDWGRQSSYYGNNGWAIRNEQIGSGVGVKILD